MIYFFLADELSFGTCFWIFSDLVGFFLIIRILSTLWVLTAQFPDRSNNPLQASQLATYCLSDHWLPNTNCLLSLSLCIHSVSMVCFLFYIKQYLRLKTESMKYWLASRKHFPDYTVSSPPPICIWITELPFHFQKTETRVTRYLENSESSIPTCAEPTLEILPDFISNRAEVLLSNLARGLDSALSIP